MKKIVLTALAISLLLFSLAEGIQLTDAQPLTITIKADGSIDPSNVAILREGNIYTVTADLASSISIEKENIVVDGAKHTLQGPGSDKNFIAVTLMAGNITVENFRVSGWKAGVYGAYNNATIANNIFTNNSQAIAVYANDYIIEGNAISGSSDRAILIDGGATRPQGDNNLITQNQIENNNWAIDILNSNGTIISKNNITSNAVILVLGTQKANPTVAGFHLLYLNNFVNNAQTLNVPFGGPFISGAVTLSPAGQWDNGSVGNYWSDYQSRYPNATEIEKSGFYNLFWDTPYMIIDSKTYTHTYANGTEITGTAVLGKAIDRYPLISAFSGTNALNPIPTISPSPTVTSTASLPPQTAFPSPSIPEFPTSIILLMVTGTILLLVTLMKTKRSKETKPH